MSKVCEDSLQGRQDISPQALQHLSNTYRCIKQNLQKNGTPSDSTVAAVMSMAIHDDLRGQPDRGKVHVNALQRMVELRGGITQFEANRALVQKICRYAPASHFSILDITDEANTELIFSTPFMTVLFHGSIATSFHAK